MARRAVSCLSRRLGAAAVVAVAAGALAGTAAATGGPTISSAPPAPLGATLYGNTSTDPLDTVTENLGPGSSCPGAGEFWIVSLTAGDEMTLKGASLSPASGLYVEMFPAGTTDASLASTQPLFSDPLVDVQLTVTKTGAYPVLIGTSTACGASDGPFNFAVIATHDAVIVLPHLKRIGEQGTFTAKVQAPDGHPVNDVHLHLKLFGVYKRSAHVAAKPHLLGHTTAEAGAAAFSYRLPASLKGKRVRLKVVGVGAGYRPLAAVSRSFKVG